MKTLFLQSKVEKLPEPILGTVEETIARDRPGRVECMASSWPAQFYQPDSHSYPMSLPDSIVPGTPIKIVATRGITLLVMPVDSTELS
jgi:membrane protein implicated in regulation of membrane protease activity